MIYSKTDDDTPLVDQIGLPSADTLILFQDIEVDRSGGLQGVRDEGLLHSAIGSVISAIGLDPSIDHVEAAARLSFAIMNNHPFADGNKRTALGAAEMTLKAAGFEIEEDPQVICDAVAGFAAEARDPSEIASWMRSRLVENSEFRVEGAMLAEMAKQSPDAGLNA